MKKYLTMIAVVMAFGFANAQDATTGADQPAAAPDATATAPAAPAPAKKAHKKKEGKKAHHKKKAADAATAQ